MSPVEVTTSSLIFLSKADVLKSKVVDFSNCDRGNANNTTSTGKTGNRVRNSIATM